MKHLSFPSIEQYRTVIKTVRDNCSYHNLPLPVLFFNGTVKLHGTNASVVYDVKDNLVYAQSRSRVLSLVNDNAGFCQWFESNKFLFQEWLKSIAKSEFRYISVYGEWCGGNIQRGVGICQLSKMFVVFAIRFTNLNDEGNPVSIWNMDDIVVPENDIGLYSINKFSNYQIKIDFNCPEEAQNQLINITEGVEAECPVAKYFGVSGIGEGVVWHTSFNNNTLLFKVKGERHVIGNKILGIHLSIEDEKQVLDYCIKNKIKEFTYTFSSD